MDDTVIRFQNISKKYKIRSGGLRHAVQNAVLNLNPLHWLGNDGRKQFPKNESIIEDESILWALRDVSFEVKQGEALGIIGPNGAGKSTILKLLSGITSPNSGNIKMKGRTGALIEVGAGFHSELTGRENIYLNGAILGLKKKEIDEKFESIVAFSELKKFIDTPVKKYSSGMYVRLGFAVIAHLDPDVLLIDEVLAVGDMSFRRKCLKKMDQFRESGKTIVFISHNLTSVQRLCRKVIWLEQGQIREFDSTVRVIKGYVDEENKRAANSEQASASSFDRNLTRDVVISQVRLLDVNGNPRDRFLLREPMGIEIRYKTIKEISDPNIGVAIYTDDAIKVSYSDTKMFACYVKLNNNEGIVKYSINSLPLMPGRYSVTVGITDSVAQCDLRMNAAEFMIKVDDATAYAASLGEYRHGLINLDARWEFKNSIED